MAEAVFAKVKAYLDSRDKSIPSKVPYTFKFIVTSEGATYKTFVLDLKNFAVSYDAAAPADVTITVDKAAVVEVFEQKVEATQLIAEGKALIDGDVELLLQLKPFLDKLRAS